MSSKTAETSSKTAAKTTADDEETYPCACCDKEMALHEVNDGPDGWVCDACIEELSSDDELTDYEEVYNGRKSIHPSMDSNDWEAYDLYVSNTQMEWDNEGDEFIGGWQESKRWL